MFLIYLSIQMPQELLTSTQFIKLQTSTRKEFDYILEALRGFLSIIVVVSHIIVFNINFEPNFFPSNLTNIRLPAQLAVLIFFVLSGYVIGLSTPKMETKNDIAKYFKKRIIRIYPIYLISIILSVLVAKESYSFTTILSNLTFTQIIFQSVIFENSPIWSLQYEVVYYLVFIPILYFRLNPIKLCILSIFISILSYIAFPFINIPVLISYSVGLVFWLSGLILASHFKGIPKIIDFKESVSMLFLLLSLLQFNVFHTALIKTINAVSVTIFGHEINFNNVYWAKAIIGIPDFAYLPYCILFILKFVGFKFKYEKLVTLFLLLSPILTFIHLAKSFYNPKIFEEFIIPTIFYILSLIVYFSDGSQFNKVYQTILTVGTWLGKISYGIYITHFPILILFGNVYKYSGSLLTYILRIFLFFSVTIIFSYLLENKLQPILKKTSLRYFK